jgi:hypothetical protein
MLPTDKIKSYRYPGVRPFSTYDSDIFFGRETDMNSLYKLIMLEKIVVLFGKSGHGKSSLINAGLIPKLNSKNHSDRSHYHPIEIRIGKVSGQNVTIIQKLKLKLDEQFQDLPEWDFLDNFQEAPVLWNNFKKKQTNYRRKFILIFDQFEQFFSYSAREQEAFRWELAELLFNEVPQAIREKIDEISNEQYALISSKLDIKVLFSIRADRLSLLHSMKDALPSILHNRFEIKALTIAQAKDAIILPALKQDNKFITHAFSYDTPSIEIILKELSTIQGNDSDSIEAFHLQIICQACESKIEEKLQANIIDTEINLEDLPEFKNLYQEYYIRQIEKLPPDLRMGAHLLLEEGLIFEDEQTGECHRLSVDANILRREFTHLGVQDNTLNLLENNFLIRREANTVGGFSYEISHDTLMVPIIKVKEERKIQEELQSQISAIKEQALKKSAGRKRRQITLLTCTFLLALMLLIWNWKAIYFLYLSNFNQGTKPVVRLEQKLNNITNDLKTQISIDARKINYDPSIGNWTASQIMTGLKDDLSDSIKGNFFKQTSKSIADASCCCWSESANQNDIRASGWIVSAIGTLKLTPKYPCNIINFLLDNQLDDGSWSMLRINKSLTQYSSTYATCHVLRALHNSLPNIPDPSLRSKIHSSIRKGSNWLLNNAEVATRPLWDDYPKNKTFEGQISKSLSGLAIHTLNLLGYASPDLNKKWLRTLETSQSMEEIYYKETSDMFYTFSFSGAELRDLTRHLIIPWQIIGTIDAYKDGNAFEKTKANIWIDNVISQLDADKIRRNPTFIKAEIYISLRYLQHKDYSFK